jgi:hypothetical protein
LQTAGLTALTSILAVLAAMGLVQIVNEVRLQSVHSPIAVSSDRLDFGKIPLNASEAREIVVRNDSPAPLHARFAVRDSAYSVDPQEVILHPGVEWSIRIVACPARLGRLDDYLTILVVGDHAAGLVIPLMAVAEPVTRSVDPSDALNRV